MDAISQAIEHKIQALVRGEQVVMTDAEMDYMDENTEIDYVSVPNPDRVGIHDRWLVYMRSQPTGKYITCPSCEGSGLRLNYDGEPDECVECGGNTVVPKYGYGCAFWLKR